MAKRVITQVPWSGATPRLPDIVGMETLAIVESSTCMKVPSASPIEMTASGMPSSGGRAAAWLGDAGEVITTPQVASSHVSDRT